MRTPIFRKAQIAMAASLIGITGCENLSTTEAGLMAAAVAGGATGIALGTTGVPAGAAIPISIGTGLGAGVLAATATNLQVSRERRAYTENLGRSLVAKASSNGLSDIPRYILVDTITTSPKSGRAVMIYDTHTGRVATDRIYYTNQLPGPSGILSAAGLR